MKFYPYKKVLAMLKGGRKCFGIVFLRTLEVLTILKGHIEGA